MYAVPTVIRGDYTLWASCSAIKMFTIPDNVPACYLKVAFLLYA